MVKPQRAKERLQISTIEREADFAVLREPWNSLLKRSTADTIFLTWEWLYTWWQHFGAGRQLSIMLVRYGDEIVGIAPFCYQTIRIRGILPLRSLQWLGTGAVGSDYLSLIATPEYEKEVCDLVCYQLTRCADQWDLLRLTDLLDNSRIYQRLCELLGQNRELEWQPGREYICPYIQLADHCWDSYQAMLSANMRYNLRRCTKQVFQYLGGELVSCQWLQDVKPRLDQIFELHQRRWSLQGGSDGFTGQHIQAFHHTVAERLFQCGWLRLYLLEIDHRTVAGIYGFEYGGVFSFYQSGFDPELNRYSVGTVLLGQTIKQALANRLMMYDFLHGAEEYKFRWTQTVRHTHSLLVYPRQRLRPKLYCWLRKLKARLINLDNKENKE
ncbi:MAG: GNAT family N-acetyltransferase [Acidobacteriota bacterium]